MDLKHTLYELSHGVVLITMNRPSRLNAFSHAMGKEMITLFKEADADDAVRVVVVTGAGKGFCAGMELEGAATFDYSAVPAAQHRDGGGQLALAINSCRKPVIAAINGAAVGVGITMTLAMDVRIAAAEAKIGFVFTRRGLVPDACSSWFLPRIVGMGKAQELMLSGRVFPAREEAHSGLFNQVLPSGEVLPRALELARDMAQNTSATSTVLTKAMLWHSLNLPDPQAAHLIESRVFHWLSSQPDVKEGVESFLQKRPARFSMRPNKDMPDFYPWWTATKV